ncbi:MAG: hypothetical protein GX603_01495 [Chloroflexi bacterium]|nr:hypothetical protein [Chloroflexota bacterium]
MISIDEFLVKLRTSAQLPGTAAPLPVLYNPIFQKILDEGDTAIVVHTGPALVVTSCFS